MTTNVTINWDLPATRANGDMLLLTDIRNTIVEISASGTVSGFVELAAIAPSEAQQVFAPDLELGEWQFRFTVFDTLDQGGTPHTEVVMVVDVPTVPVVSPPSSVMNVVVTQE